MSILLLDQDDNEPSKILERNGLIKRKKTEADTFANELEKSVQEATTDLPLGKALYLLLNVHGQVFDKAVYSMQNSTKSELAIKVVESPTVKAIVSIENYISHDTTELFKQIYDSLKDKLLKRQPNEAAMRIISYFALHSDACQIQVQQFLVDQLEKPDKKDQLAVVVLLQFFSKHYSASVSKISWVFIQPLVQLVEMRSEQPTLLNCSACELVLKLAQKALTDQSDTTTTTKETTTTKITQVEIVEPTDVSPQIVKGLKKIWSTLEKWQKSKTKLELAAYEELHEIKSTTYTTLNAILKYITPKSILSEKPLTIKKQKQILSDPEADSSAQLLILALLQKGQWIALYGDNQGTVVKSTEQDEIKSLIQQRYESSIQLKHLIPQLVTIVPHLFPCSTIDNSELIQSILDQVEEISDEIIDRLTPMAMNQPEASICYLLMHVLQQDSHSQFAYDMLAHLVTAETDRTVPILQENLLSVVNQSNPACELLIQCMAFTDLRSLIQKLMIMSVEVKERERTICIALISKALLQEHWASYSIIDYIESVRDFKFYKGFFNIQRTCPKGPQDIPTSRHVEIIQSVEESKLDAVSASLLMPLQLWSSRVNEKDFRLAIRQLVQYCCGIPRNSVWIEAWKQFSYEFLSNHQRVWPVVEACTDALKMQISLTIDTKRNEQLQETILFFRLAPMLILQTLPKEAYSILLLPHSYVNVVAHKLEEIGVSKDQLRISQNQDEHSPISIQLMDELLQRSLKADGAANFSISLIEKLFCV